MMRGAARLYALHVALAALGLLVWGGVLHPDLRAPLLAAAACASLLVCGAITLAIGALLASRYPFILRPL